MTVGKKTVDVLSGMASLAQRYQGLMLDQFGVMHNGTTALPGAVECVTQLHKKGLKMIVLSNSPQNEESTMSRLGNSQSSVRTYLHDL